MELLYLCGAIAGIVWLTVYLSRASLWLSATVVVVVGVVGGYGLWHRDVGPLPLTLDRLLWAVLIGQLLVAFTLRSLPATRWLPADLSLAAFALALVASTFSHDWAVDHLQPVSRLLFLYAMPLGLYAVARHLELDERSVRRLLITLVVLGTYLSATAVAEVAGVHAVVFPRYIVSGEFPEFLGRGRGPLLNPVGNGLVISLAAAAWLTLWPRVARGRWALLAAAPILLAGVACTLTRSVWLGAAGATLAIAWEQAARPTRQRLLVGSLLAACLLAVVAHDKVLSFKRDKHLSAAEAAESVSLRPLLAAVAWDMFRAQPLAGCGFGQYIHASGPYHDAVGWGIPVDKVRGYVQHNTLLNLLAETGLLGTLPWLLWLALTVRAGLRVRRRVSPGEALSSWPLAVTSLWIGFLVAFLANAMFHDVSLIPMMNAILFFCGGLAVRAEAEQLSPSLQGARHFGERQVAVERRQLTPQA